MKYSVRLHIEGRIIENTAVEGTKLSYLLHKNRISINSPCGGNGTCGKCKVRISGQNSKPAQLEQSLLGKDNVEKGIRLACYTVINSDMDVYLDEQKGAQIITDGKQRKVKLQPTIEKKFISLVPPDINNQLSDLERVCSYLKLTEISENLDIIRELPDLLRKSDFKITIGIMDNKIIFAESGDTTDKLYGIAFDIGTTTIAAYLLDMKTGEKLDVYSIMNPQSKFGADVISRIDYTLQSEESRLEMHQTITRCINEIISVFCTRRQFTKKDVYSVTIVGNATMMHFLMNLPAGNLAVSPFIPATTKIHKIESGKAGIDINPYGYVVFMPSVSAYIGADTIAAIISSGMYTSKKISLLVDIGTNGEIVLGNTDWMYACSAAAGPAFEGANISNGVGGVKGAIDSISINGDVSYTTIGNERAIGICGSGVVDAVASMLSAGIIEDTGRLLEPEDILDTENDEISSEIKNRLCNIDGFNSFVIAYKEESGSGSGILINQKDVRELQNAKAAIAAGIKVLAKQAGIKLGDIVRVYLAGGFGSYINIDNALLIGLLPRELRGKIAAIGNAAGAGAVEALISVKILKVANKLKNKIKYVELSTSSDFVNEYVDCMMFEAE